MVLELEVQGQEGGFSRLRSVIRGTSKWRPPTLRFWERQNTSIAIKQAGHEQLLLRDNHLPVQRKINDFLIKGIIEENWHERAFGLVEACELSGTTQSRPAPESEGRSFENVKSI